MSDRDITSDLEALDEHPTSDELDDDLYDAMYQDGLSAYQRFQEASKVAEEAIKALAAAEDRIEELEKRSGDGSCYYCNGKTNRLAGNPMYWPLWFPHSDGPGNVQPHHVKCVLKRLGERDEALEALRDELLFEEPTQEWEPDHHVCERCGSMNLGKPTGIDHDDYCPLASDVDQEDDDD